MGCCFSGPTAAAAAAAVEEEAASSQLMSSTRNTENQPLQTNCAEWQSDKPMTMEELRTLQETFWHTSPSYQGHAEIWQSLQAVCEVMHNDHELAQAILNSSEISIPNGRLTDGCFDARGNRYVIPAYCISPPTNLLASSAAKPNAKENKTETVMEDKIELQIRLMNSKDFTLVVNNSQQISAVKKLITEHEKVAGKVRLFQLGKEIHDNQRVADLKKGILQALIVVQ